LLVSLVLAEIPSIIGDLLGSGVYRAEVRGSVAGDELVCIYARVELSH